MDFEILARDFGHRADLEFKEQSAPEYNLINTLIDLRGASRV